MNSTLISKISLKKMTPFYTSSLRTFAVKQFKSNTVLENGKSVSQIGEAKFEFNHAFEELLGTAGACEISSIGFFAKMGKIPIEKIEVSVNGEYDTDVYLGKKEGKNTYSFINVETKIYSSEKDKKKLEETVNKGIERCPVLSTLKLAGIPITKKVSYH